MRLPRSAAYAWPASRVASSTGGYPWGPLRLRRLLACGLLTLLVASSSRSQEALLSNLGFDRSANRGESHKVTAPGTPHLGPVQIELAIESSAQFSDNVSYSQESPQSDTVLGNGFSTLLAWPISESSRLALNGGLTYYTYLSHPNYNRLETGPGSFLSWNVGFPNGALTLFDQFSYMQDVASEVAVTGVASFPRYDNTTGLRLTWTPERWFLQGGYSHDLYFTDSSTYNYLNRGSEYFFARAARRAAEETEAGLEASASLTAYELPIQNNNTSLSLGPYADWRLTRALDLVARGGWTAYYFDVPSGVSGAGPASTLNSYYLGLEVHHQLTDFFSHGLSIQRQVRLGVNLGSDYVEQLTLVYNAALEITSRITLSAGLTYELGSQPWQTMIIVDPGFGFPVTVMENFDRFTFTPSATWKAADRLGVGLAYAYALRQSNLADRGYSQNSLTVRLTFTF